MASYSKPVFIHGIASINSNSSIAELISFAQSAFRPSDFDLVERILVDRESYIKKEYDLMEKKHGEAVLVNLQMEDELEKYKQEVESLRKVQREKDELILQLNEEIEELKCSKRRADSEVEVYKKRYKVLEQRVVRLEGVIATLVSEFPTVQIQMEKDLKVEQPVPDATGEKENGDEKIHTSLRGGSTSCSPELEQNGLQEADVHSFDDACGNGRPDKIMGSSRPQFGDIIEIDDSDDEKPLDFKLSEGKERSCIDKSVPAATNKRKRSSRSVCSNDDTGKVVPSTALKSVFIRHCGEKPERKRNSQVVSSSSDSDDSSDSGDENYSDSCIENMIAELRRRKENRAC